MYRTITIAVPSPATDEIVRALQRHDGVIGLAVHRGASLKPPGDQLVVESLNDAADDVLESVQKAAGDGAFSVTTAEAASLTERQAQARIDADHDEASWEEMESRLLQEGSCTSNFIALTALGGAVAATGLTAEPVPQALALVAASVIAPGFEPLAKFPLGLALRRWGLAWSGLRSAAVAYAVVIVAASLTLWGLIISGVVTPDKFSANPHVQRLTAAPIDDLVVSAGGAVAGMVMIASFRHDVIAGALMALMLVPAASTVGGALVLRRSDLVVGGAQRAGIDVLLMICAGVLVFGIKRLTVHRRDSLRR
jgi:hypothetical protein